MDKSRNTEKPRIGRLDWKFRKIQKEPLFLKRIIWDLKKLICDFKFNLKKRYFILK